MPNPIDYALFAANAYSASQAVVHLNNEIPLPTGWTVMAVPANSGVNNATGFLARAYKSTSGEIVIAYGGTTSEDGMAPLDWTKGNLPGATGLSLGEQVVDAARFYLDVLQTNSQANISFTGHSLGGGLAALMAVYFGREAHTFDQAPFAQSASTSGVVNGLKSRLTGLNYVLPSEFSAFDAGTSLDLRKGLVTQTFVKGEALQYLGNPIYAAAIGAVLGGPAGAAAGALIGSVASGIAGTIVEKDAGSSVGAVDLHSMALLTAIIQSEKFRQASKANPELLQQIFQSKFSGDQKLAEHNFLNLMIQQQAAGNQALDALAEGIAKFTGALDPVASGATSADSKLKTALYQLAIALYYDEGENHTGVTNTPFDNLIKTVTGGIQFTPDPGRPNDYKAALKTVLFELGQYSDFAGLKYDSEPKAERYTLPTAGAMNVAAAVDGKSDLMVGSTQADTLGAGDGNDILIGGKDSDTLTGGAGNDLYVFNSGDGADIIIDDGANRLIYDGELIAGLVVKDASTGQYKFVDNSGKTIEFHSPGVLTLADGDTITFQNQTSADMLDGSFGLQLFEETAAPGTSRTFTGDYQPLDFDVTQDGIQIQIDDLGNIILDSTKPAPGRADSFNDSAGNDIIQGFGGNDFINSWRGGDDILYGGEGDDWLLGGAGNDLVEGGFGRDVLVERDGNDKLYADGIVTVTDALAAENATSSGLQGEALTGGTGDDLAIGGIGNDVLFGGRGDDILVAGAGDDTIEGDVEASNILPDWTVTRTVTNTTYFRAYTQTYYDLATEGGADAIYAGAGVDWVFAGFGNDYVDGGNDADVLFGEAGNDDLFGGSGNDMIVGDTSSLPLSAHGDDYLDGEDGDDTVFGQGGSDQVFGGVGADQLYGNEGDDYLDGEDGNDVLVGGEGADQLFGGVGADFLQGDAGNGVGDGNDYLDGEAGDDILLGLGGSDELHGGDGNDQIAGDNGGTDGSGSADTIHGEAGNDFIDGQGGDDVIDAGADNDIVAGGLGNDQIAGGTGSDQLQGGAGDDQLDGGADADTLFGEAGNDKLLGGAGNDYLIGGLGDDVIDGGDGDDVYFYTRGDGRDRFVDSAGTDWLVFNDLTWGQIRLGVGSLLLTLPDGGEIHLDNFDPDNPYTAAGIDYFQFADGAVLSQGQLIDALGIQPTGTPEADVLSGTALAETIDALAGDDVVTARAGNDTVQAGDGADVVYAGDGNDVVFGGNGDDVLLGEAGDDTLIGDAGNDLLAGGTGTDVLQGGEGDDTYLFQMGDGEDTASDALGQNAIALGAGLALDAVVFTRQGSDLLVAVKNSTDRLTVKDWFAAGSTFASLSLGDGTLLDHAGVDAAMPRNQAPLAAPDSGTAVEDAITEITGNALANDSDPEGRVLRVTDSGIRTGSAGTFSLGSSGGWSYVLDNGSTAVQSLAAGQSLTESFVYTVTDDDPNGAATAASSIDISVLGANDLPLLGADSAATAEDATVPLTGNLLANDSDIDAGTVLTIADPGAQVGAYGTLNLAADGAWRYDLANATTAVQSLAAGQSVTENFTPAVSDGIVQVGGKLAISIIGRNDAPIIASALADQSVAANTSWSWTLPAGSFADIDAGDMLGYGATLADGTALPSWLAFDAATQTFSGRVPKSASGRIDIRVAATDRLGESAADVFTLSFAAGTGGGGGGGGGSQGNEGVGNGVDAPPPGHDASFNDGAGTGPGNPGAQGGNGYRPPSRADIVLTQVQIATPVIEAQGPAASHGNSDAAHAAAPGQIKQAAGETDALSAAAGSGGDPAAVSPAPTLTAAPDEAASGPLAAAEPAVRGKAVETAWLGDTAWAYLDRTDSSNQPTGKSGDSVAVFARWLAVEQALARDSADGMPDWLDRVKGADLRGLLAANGGFVGSNQIFGTDAIGLLAGGELKGFKGLAEGVQKIA